MAAGLGFKTFNTGDVLSAADVNGYLMQGVWVFANATARTSAVTSPQEGNVSFLRDTNSLEIYDGAAWVAYGAGDITGVTAGTGISGGGTSGTVTITNSMATAIDAKGDLIVGTGADAFSRLAVGATNGHVLTVDSAEATGLKWAAASGGGKVLQVVTATTSTPTTIASTTLTDTGLSASITPSSTGSRVLVLSSATWSSGRLSDATEGSFRLVRGSTALVTYDKGFGFYQSGGAAQSTAFGVFTNAYVDSPSTTSSTTYKTQAAVNTTANGHSITFQTNNSLSQIILMEIGA